MFSRAVFQRYTDHVCQDIANAEAAARQMGGQFERVVDSVYLGGGTPTILDIDQLQKLFVTISQNFQVLPASEVTVECAPGTLTPAVLEAFARCGVNRVSLGVQSFVDDESRSVGRLHTRDIVLHDIEALRKACIPDINIDLIAGLPHQTAESWEFSLKETIATGVPHVSVYMLEVDEDSRLGRELIAGGTKYHAHFVPDDDLTVDMYTRACETLESGGIRQYEISNFARESAESKHNLKYWTRQPYLGFGVDAHSMLIAEAKAPHGMEHFVGLNAHASTYAGNDRGLSSREAVRFATPDSLEGYVAGGSMSVTHITEQAAIEECFFLGLRLNRGIDLRDLPQNHSLISELVGTGLLEQKGPILRLTPRGRLLSNEVFEKFILVSA